jgi:hypothetical protein
MWGAAVMSELTPAQEEADGFGRVLELPPVDGPVWTGDDLTISREWVAFKEHGRRGPWDVVPYAAVSSVRGGIVLVRSDGLAWRVIAATLPLEACNVLADGLSTNPAVAQAARELLAPYLAVARARRDARLRRMHKVSRSGTTHTFYVLRGFHLVTGIVAAVFGVGLVAGQVVAAVYPSSKWAQGDTSAWDLIWGTALGLLFAWLGVRLVRVGVHITAEKMSNRGYFITRTVKASEIRAITLHPKDNGQGKLRWIPQVELTSGKNFSIASFDCGPARKPPKPEMAVIIEDVRALLGVKADTVSMSESQQPGAAAE